MNIVDQFDELLELNARIAANEKSHNVNFFEQLLSREFLFRRASGKVITRTAYIEDLPHTRYDLLVDLDIQLFPLNKSCAYITSRVFAKGKRPDGLEFSGSFKNVRFYRKQHDQWTLYAWHNTNLAETEKNAADNFKGQVAVQTIYDQPDRKEYEVFFHPSSRTNWHIHTNVQQLFVTSGTAWVFVKTPDEDKQTRVSAGEYIEIIPGTMHCHGAAQGTFMIHVASNKLSGQQFTYWFNEVTDEEYTQSRTHRTNLNKVVI